METNIADNKTLNSNKPSTAMESFKKSVGKMADTPLTEQIAEKAEELKADTLQAYDSSLQMVRANPLTSLAVATGLGVVIGLFLKRRH